jgi:hypothetical protein
MARRQVFYSFYYDADVMRVQQIRNMGAFDENTPASVNQWEEVKRGGDNAIKRWIDDNMAYRSCVVVLIGDRTAERKWVLYEIKKAWSEGKGLLGVHIHNIRCPRTAITYKGSNPLEFVTTDNGTKLSSIIRCYDPLGSNAYYDIKTNLSSWIEAAVKQRENY